MCVFCSKDKYIHIATVVARSQFVSSVIAIVIPRVALAPSGVVNTWLGDRLTMPGLMHETIFLISSGSNELKDRENVAGSIDQVFHFLLVSNGQHSLKSYSNEINKAENPNSKNTKK